MGQNIFCDLCHKTLPNVEALQPLKFGEDVIAGLCLTCSSALRTGIQKKLAEAQAAFTAAVQQPAEPAPAQPELSQGSGDPLPPPPVPPTTTGAE